MGFGDLELRISTGLGHQGSSGVSLYSHASHELLTADLV